MMLACWLLGAVLSVSVEPLADADVLEQSILNEVEHALDLAPREVGTVSEASVEFAAVCSTNGANATERAIRLVSAQKDGRWFWRGTDVTPVAVRFLRRAAGMPDPPIRLSIFANHIEAIADQEKLSFAEAARHVRTMGYEGVDVMEGLSTERLEILKKVGFEIACVIGFTKFEGREDLGQRARLIAMAKACSCRTIMLVPGFYPAVTNREPVLSLMVERTSRFAAAAAKEGLETVVEDFDVEAAPTYGLGRLSRFLAAVPSVGFVYDTGNFNAPGERPENGLQWLGRVRHFHLKDHAVLGERRCVAIGSGAVPTARIISAARDAGYGGWFTVEHFDVTNMLECAEHSARFLRGRHF